jgi:hypothetical protein
LRRRVARREKQEGLRSEKGEARREKPATDKPKVASCFASKGCEARREKREGRSEKGLLPSCFAEQSSGPKGEAVLAKLEGLAEQSSGPCFKALLAVLAKQRREAKQSCEARACFLRRAE